MVCLFLKKDSNLLYIYLKLLDFFKKKWYNMRKVVIKSDGENLWNLRTN